MADAAPAPAKSSGGLSRLLLWLIVLVLLGAVWWLASERNERRFRLEQDNGQLTISRGRFFPFGASEIRADDPALGKIYGPISAPAGNKLPAGELEYDDQTALDRALFDLLVPWAKAAAQKGDAAALDLAGGLADRASALPGLTPAQHAELASLRGDLAFSAARTDLKAAAQLVQSARRKLATAREGSGEHALEAGALSSALEQVGAALLEGAEGRQPRAVLPVAAPSPAAAPASPTLPGSSPTALPATPTATGTPGSAMSPAAALPGAATPPSATAAAALPTVPAATPTAIPATQSGASAAPVAPPAHNPVPAPAPATR